MLVLALEWNLFFTRNTLVFEMQLWGGVPSQPALCHPCGSGWSARCTCGSAPKEKVAVDLHLVVLADWDGAHVAFVVKLRRRRWQSTCTSSFLRIGMECMLYLWRSSQGEGGSRPASRRPCGLGCVLYLGENWTAAKPSSGRVSLHTVGFFKLRGVLDCS